MCSFVIASRPLEQQSSWTYSYIKKLKVAEGDPCKRKFWCVTPAVLHVTHPRPRCAHHAC